MIAKGKQAALLNDKFSRAALLVLFFFSPRNIVVKPLSLIHISAFGGYIGSLAAGAGADSTNKLIVTLPGGSLAGVSLDLSRTGTCLLYTSRSCPSSR